MSNNGDAPRTRVEQTFHAVRGDIISGELAPGERLGVVGSSGSSTGPHLHLELLALRAAQGNRRLVAIDRFDDTVGAACGHGKTLGHFVHRHMMHAVDPDLAVAVDAFHQRIRLDGQPMSMPTVLQVLVGDRGRQILRQMLRIAQRNRHEPAV